MYLGYTRNFSLEEVDRTGSPRKKIFLILDKDRRVTYHRINKTLGLNAPTIRFILKDHLDTFKLWYLYMLHSLIEGQKTKPVKWCRETLKCLIRKLWQYVDNIVARHGCTIMICRPSLKTKFGSLNMKLHTYLSE